MKIRIVYPFVGDSVGGSHISTLTLIKNLDLDKFFPIILIHEKGAFSDFLDKNKIEYKTLRIPAYAGSTPHIHRILLDAKKSLKLIRNFITENNIDIIHGNDIRINITWSLCSLFSHAKFIWHQRSIPHSSKNIWRFALIISNKLICISSSTHKTFSRFPQKGKASIIKNPIEVEEKPNTPIMDIHSELKVNKAKKIIGFAGRLVDIKRPEFFIEVVSHINSLRKDYVHGVLVGSYNKEMKKKLEKLIHEKNATNIISIIGFRSPIENYIKQFDVLLATSINEGFGRVVVEAMLLDTPVIASNSGGYKEIIEHQKTGILCETDSTEDFAEKTLEILDNTEVRKKIISAGKVWAKSQYSANNHARNIMNIYSELCEND